MPAPQMEDKASTKLVPEDLAFARPEDGYLKDFNRFYASLKHTFGKKKAYAALVISTVWLLSLVLIFADVVPAKLEGLVSLASSFKVMFVVYFLSLFVWIYVIPIVWKLNQYITNWVVYHVKRWRRFYQSVASVLAFRNDAVQMAREFRSSPRDFSLFGWHPCLRAYNRLLKLDAVEEFEEALEDNIHPDLSSKALLILQADQEETLMQVVEQGEGVFAKLAEEKLKAFEKTAQK